MSLNEARQDAENRCLSCAYLVASGVRAPTWRSRVRCFLACVGQRTHARKPVGGPLDPPGRGRARGRASKTVQGSGEWCIGPAIAGRRSAHARQSERARADR